jgi:hypothetical protein
LDTSYGPQAQAAITWNENKRDAEEALAAETVTILFGDPGARNNPALRIEEQRGAGKIEI